MTEDDVRSILSDMYTCLPGRIETYDGSVASVRVAMAKQLTNGDILIAPIIVSVPIHWPVGSDGAASITVPLKKGDNVTLHFACRSLDNWLSGDDGAPDDPRQFDLTDAFATPVMRPGTGKADTENVVVRHGEGSLSIAPNGTITADGPGFICNAPATFREAITYEKGIRGKSGAGSNTAVFEGNVQFIGPVAVAGDMAVRGGGFTYNDRTVATVN